jgi:hypothetical protein
MGACVELLEGAAGALRCTVVLAEPKRRILPQRQACAPGNRPPGPAAVPSTFEHIKPGANRHQAGDDSSCGAKHSSRQVSALPLIIQQGASASNPPSRARRAGLQPGRCPALAARRGGGAQRGGEQAGPPGGPSPQDVQPTSSNRPTSPCQQLAGQRFWRAAGLARGGPLWPPRPRRPRPPPPARKQQPAQTIRLSR